MPYLDISTNTACQYLALDLVGENSAAWAAGASNFVTVYRNDFSTNIESSYSGGYFFMADVMTVGGSGISFVTNPTAMGLDNLNGVWKFVVTPQSSNEESIEAAGAQLDVNEIGIAITCDIDCCIATKMTAYLAKSCDCSKGKCCDKELESIYKIFMLAEAAKTHAAEGQYDEAYEKYNQATTLCNAATNSCDCNCG